MAKRLLEHKGFPFEEIDVDRQPEARKRMIGISNRYTVPQIFINQLHIGGCDDLYALESAGRLDALLLPAT